MFVVFRQTNFCDNPRNEAGDNPFDSMDPEGSVREAEPSAEPRTAPAIRDSPEDVNGLNADTDTDNQPVGNDVSGQTGNETADETDDEGSGEGDQ